MATRRVLLWIGLAAGSLGLGCCADTTVRPDAGDDGGPPPWSCTPPATRCAGEYYQICVQNGEFTRVESHNCVAELGPGSFCVEGVGCSPCYPGMLRCNGDDAERCEASGSSATWGVIDRCDIGRGLVCVSGACQNSCEVAVTRRSNVGCEYWAVDLDNANINNLMNAAGQQFAVIVSNPGRSLADVFVERNEAALGSPPMIEQLGRDGRWCAGSCVDMAGARISTARVPPGDLEVLRLDSREVDGSAPGSFDTGEHTAASSNAYRITSTLPVVAYQFNPLENVNVFSNDASLLIPTSGLGRDYIVMGWPQTIAPDPRLLDWNRHLRAFLTIVGAEAGPIHVTVNLSTPIVGNAAQGIPAFLAGDVMTYALGPYDVLNLETGEFNADFTGTTINADGLVAVFSGSEASDVPYFAVLEERQCCADHLEEQIWPEDSHGWTFVAARTPSRTAAVREAGGRVGLVNEPEYFRVMGIVDGTTVVTTLPPEHPRAAFGLNRGDRVTIRADQDFEMAADHPVVVGQFMVSQAGTGIPTGWPGGDPSFILVPPVDQYRKVYVFLTPDKYSFDFVNIIAEPGTQILLDNAPLPPECVTTAASASGLWNVIRCQLSFPVIDESTAPPTILPGALCGTSQCGDGVHTLEADRPIGAIVSGFDSYVSYGYPAGSDLERTF